MSERTKSGWLGYRTQGPLVENRYWFIAACWDQGRNRWQPELIQRGYIVGTGPCFNNLEDAETWVREHPVPKPEVFQARTAWERLLEDDLV